MQPQFSFLDPGASLFRSPQHPGALEEGFCIHPPQVDNFTQESDI